jgi:hypothetical protein
VYAPDELAGPGDSVIVDPLGAIVAGPAHGEEALLYAEAPASAALLARRGFDPVGHYGRGDVFALQVHGVSLPLELNAPPALDALGDHIWRVPGQAPAPASAPDPFASQG